MNQIKSKKSGATIALIIIGIVVGLFFLVAVVGIIAAIAIPSLISATDHAKTAETISTMKQMVAALESYYVNRGSYPETSQFEELSSVLVPEYLGKLPEKDAWGNPFRYETDETGNYYLISLGRNGSQDVFPPYPVHPMALPGSSADIIYHQGSFICYPAGASP